MLTVQQLKTLKSSNVIKDGEKGKTRLAEDYSSATKEQKKTATELAGLNGATITNVKKRGTASAKIVLGIAQALNVSPYYYTGAVDEKGEYTDEVQKQFLTEYGYDSLAAGKRPYNRKKDDTKPAKKSDSKAIEAAKAEMALTAKEADKSAKSEVAPKTEKIDKPETASENTEQPVKDLSKDDMLTLVAALHIRAGLSGEAKVKLDGIKAILLS